MDFFFPLLLKDAAKTVQLGTKDPTSLRAHVKKAP